MNLVSIYKCIKRLGGILLLFSLLALSSHEAPIVKAQVQRPAALADCPPSISFGETVQCSIAAAAEVDTYTFTANAGDSILLRMSKSGGDLSPRIKIFSGNTELCQAQDSDMAELATCILPNNGTYTILADDGSNTDTGDYHLHLQRLNNPVGAVSITFGQTVSGSIQMPAETDAYTFVAAAGDRVLSRIKRTSATTYYPRVRIYNPDGTQLCETAYTSTFVEKTDCLLLDAGMYTVLALDFYGTKIGDYALYLQRQNNPGNTVSIDIDQTLAGSIITAPEMDTYTFNAIAGDRVMVQMSRTGGNLNFPRVRVLGPNGIQLCESPVAQSIAKIASCALTTTGEHTILAFDHYGLYAGSYSLHLQRDDAGNEVPLTFGVSKEVQVTADSTAWFQIEVTGGTENLFFTFQKYGSWNGVLNLYSGAQLLASTTGFKDHIISWPSATPGTYLVQVSGSGSGKLIAYTSLPELPLGEWIVGSIYSQWGSAWYQLTVPSGQSSLHLRAETLGIWSKLKVYRDSLDGTLVGSASGPSMNIAIPSPQPGVYYVHLTDSAGIRDGDQTRDHMIRADANPIEPPPCTAPSITSFTPDKGGNAGQVTITIKGQCLAAESSLMLTRSGYDDIIATTVDGEEDGHTLSATFDLSSVEPGGWNLAITDPNLQTVIAPAPFEVIGGGEIQLEVEILGRDQIRIGRPTTYLLRIQNTGDYDTELIFAYLDLPVGITCLQVSLDGQIIWAKDTDDDPVALVIKPLAPGEELFLDALLVSNPTTQEIQSTTLIGASPVLGFVASYIGSQVTEFGQIFWKNKWDEFVGGDPNDPDFFPSLGRAFKQAYDIWKTQPSQKIATSGAYYDFTFDTMDDLLTSAGKTTQALKLRTLKVAFFDLPGWIDAERQNRESNPNNLQGGETSKSFLPITSISPEDKYGPTGYDTPSTPVNELKHWIAADQPLDYRIDFWNKEDAPAATVDVYITDSLDPNLDWSTFRFTEVGFLDWKVPLEPTQYFNVDVPNVSIDLSPYYPGQPVETMIVNVEGTFDSTTGEIRWEFHALDLLTREPPENPYAGFLPPITSSGWEIGWVNFSATPKSELASGTVISNQSFVKFDLDVFKPAPPQGPFVNTLDAAPPTSVVKSPSGSQRCMAFPVSWSGIDDANGSGLQSFDAYADDLGDPDPAYIWAPGLTAPSDLFVGVAGHSYGFFTRARDHVGNREAAPQPASYDKVVKAGAQTKGCIPPPSTPVLQFPANGRVAESLQPALDWKDSAPFVDHYRLQFSTNKTFTTPIIDATNVSSSIFTFGYNLIPGKIYYWRVKAFNKIGGASEWSDVRTFKTPLAQPTLVSPPDVGQATTDRCFFDWNSVDGASQYILQVSALNNFSTLLVNATVNTTEDTIIKDLPQNKTLYWRVRPITSTVRGPWSAKWSFKTGNPPSVPLPVFPTAGALVTDYTPLLNWNNSIVPAGTTFKQYEIELDDHNDFSSPAIHTTTTPGDITDSDITLLSDLPSNTKFYWRVRAINIVNGVDHTSGWSPVWSFRTVILPPSGLTVVPNGLQPGFDWDDATAPFTGYTIQISTSANFSTFLVNSTTPNSFYMMLKNLPAGKTLYWRVRVNGANGPSAWTTTQYTTP